MTLPLQRRLGLSLWPFVLIAPAEWLATAAMVDESGGGGSALWALTVGFISVGTSLLLAVALIPLARYVVGRPRFSRLRTVSASVAIYAVIGMLQAFVTLTLGETLGGHGGLPGLLTAIYILSRPINLVVLAIVVEQLRDGLTTMRVVNGEVAEQVALARRTNAMLEHAETSMREESRWVLTQQVEHPLRELVREAPSQSDETVADELDAFIAHRLRPLSHVLHPVSVRLGLISAVRSLNSEVTLDATPALERMDRDGVLLDDGVRLQVYRWIRDRLMSGVSTRVALVMRARELEVSIHPATVGTLDAVQVVAGLREVGRGVLRAPLRGQVPSASEIASARDSEFPVVRVRQRLRDVLTVPLPRRVEFVALIALGAMPFQLVAYRWEVDWRSIAAALTFTLAAVVSAAIFALLPRPRPTIGGASTVVLEWIVTGLVPALLFAWVATALGLYATAVDNVALDIFRGIYRFSVVGLMLVIAHGVVVQAYGAQERAVAELEAEEQRRSEILAKSRQLDADVAEALHRTVQGRLAAAVVLVRLGRRSEAWDIVEDMAGVEIPRLLERMQSPSGVIPPVPAGMKLSVFGAEALPEELVGDVRTALGEIVVNAQRHGGATEVVVRILLREGLWRIECLDNGHGVSGTAQAGLGSRLLDELSHRHGGQWSIESVADGCRVVLELPDPSRSREPSSAIA